MQDIISSGDITKKDFFPRDVKILDKLDAFDNQGKLTDGIMSLWDSGELEKQNLDTFILNDLPSFVSGRTGDMKIINEPIFDEDEEGIMGISIWDNKIPNKILIDMAAEIKSEFDSEDEEYKIILIPDKKVK